MNADVFKERVVELLLVTGLYALMFFVNYALLTLIIFLYPDNLKSSLTIKQIFAYAYEGLPILTIVLLMTHGACIFLMNRSVGKTKS